jgi:hypothetical protein
MKRDTYESKALPISFTKDQVLKGVNDQIPFVENPNEMVKAGINLKQYLNLVRSNDRAIQMAVSSGDMINTLPSANLFLEYDPESVRKMGFVKNEYQDGINGVMRWSLGERDLLKNDLIVLDIIAQNNWERPIYFGGTLSPNSYLNMKEFMQLEGYAYRLTPVRIQGARDGIVNTEVMYDRVMNKFEWRNLNNPEVYYDSETYLKVPIITARFAFLRLADQLVREGDNKRAKEVLDKCLEVMPDKSVPYDQLSANFTTFYYTIGEPEKAKEISDVIAKRADEELTYFIAKQKQNDIKEWGADNVQSYIQNNLRDLNMLISIAEQFDKPLAATYRGIYDKHTQGL